MIGLRRVGEQRPLQDLGHLALLPVEACIVQGEARTADDVLGGGEVVPGQWCSAWAGEQCQQAGDVPAPAHRQHGERLRRQLGDHVGGLAGVQYRLDLLGGGAVDVHALPGAQRPGDERALGQGGDLVVGVPPDRCP